MPVPLTAQLVSQAILRGAHGTPKGLWHHVLSTGRVFGLDPSPTLKSGIARILVQAMLRDELVVYVAEHGVWPSSEIEDLFLRVRRSEAFHLDLYECPAEAICAAEREYATCLFAVGLHCIWDICLIDLKRKAVAYASHDEVIAISADDEQFRDELCETLAAFGLRELHNFRSISEFD